MAQTKSEKLLGIKEVLEIVPVTKPTIYRLMQDGKFPASRRVTPGRVCWRQSDIDEWIAGLWGEPDTDKEEG